MDGSKGERVEKTYAFAEELSKYTDAKIEYLDERLTSVSAEKILISADVSRKKRKEVLDKLSATIILQDYLDQNNRKF
jgi:putative Holliday junction resolvase